jgi:hypothetical protein
MTLDDGLAIYKGWDSVFWDFTQRLEKDAAEILKLLVDDNYQPDDSDKGKHISCWMRLKHGKRAAIRKRRAIMLSKIHRRMCGMLSVVR